MKKNRRRFHDRMAAKFVLSLLLVFVLAFGLFQANSQVVAGDFADDYKTQVLVGQTIDDRTESDSGASAFTVNADNGANPLASQTFTLAVGEPRGDASVDPKAASFDRYIPEDVSVTLMAGSYTLDEITCNGATLAAGEDYTARGGVYTFHKKWMAQLADGEHALNFIMSGGISPTLALTVSDTTPPTVITGLPGSYTCRVGEQVVWSPQPAGGIWGIDDEYLSIAQEKDSAAFTALKAGNTEASYTVDGVTHTVSITIARSITLWLVMMPALAILCGLSGLLLYRRNRKKDAIDPA